MPKGVYKHRSGSEAPHFGKPHIQSSKDKIGAANKGRLPWNTGKHWSIKMRKKMSNSHKGEIFTDERIKKILHRRVPTSLEIKLQGIIKESNLPFVFVGNGSLLIGRRNPDFVHTSKKLAVDVYYRYFKNIDGRNVKDWQDDRRKYFEDRGWSILFIDETQVNNSAKMLKELA